MAPQVTAGSETVVCAAASLGNIRQSSARRQSRGTRRERSDIRYLDAARRGGRGVNAPVAGGGSSVAADRLFLVCAD